MALVWPWCSYLKPHLKWQLDKFPWSGLDTTLRAGNTQVRMFQYNCMVPFNIHYPYDTLLTKLYLHGPIVTIKIIWPNFPVWPKIPTPDNSLFISRYTTVCPFFQLSETRKFKQFRDLIDYNPFISLSFWNACQSILSRAWHRLGSFDAVDGRPLVVGKLCSAFKQHFLNWRRQSSRVKNILSAALLFFCLSLCTSTQRSSKVYGSDIYIQYSLSAHT